MFCIYCLFGIKYQLLHYRPERAQSMSGKHERVNFVLFCSDFNNVEILLIDFVITDQ
jgi:hypothetical protein